MIYRRMIDTCNQGVAQKVLAAIVNELQCVNITIQLISTFPLNAYMCVNINVCLRSTFVVRLVILVGKIS